MGIKSEFIRLDTNRQSILKRSRDCAALTLPFELPPEGHTEDMQLPTPWQSLGARCVNNLAAKLLLTLFPPNQPFFKLNISDKDLEKFSEGIGAKTEINNKLVSVEASVHAQMEASGLRVHAYKAIRHLICANSPLVVITDNLNVKIFPITSYVVERDPTGFPVLIITKELIDKDLVDPEILKLYQSKVTTEEFNQKKNLCIYRKAELINSKWAVETSIEDVTINDPDYKGDYTQDDFSWIVPRWSYACGENYSRGPVEEYLGDFRSYEALSQLMVEGGAAHAKLLFLVDPNGTVTPTKVMSARNGDAISGKSEEISAMKVDKGFDFRVTMETLSQIERRLSSAFLLTEGVQRDAERVTAEEIRLMANQLENALGGAYSLLSMELQMPLVKAFMRKMKIDLPKEIVPTIVTGMAGLGRNSDGYKLKAFVGSIASIPEAIAVVKMDEVTRRLCTAEGISHEGLIKTAKEIQEEIQQKNMMALAEKAAGPMAGQLVKPTTEGA